MREKYAKSKSLKSGTKSKFGSGYSKIGSKLDQTVLGDPNVEDDYHKGHLCFHSLAKMVKNHHGL